MKTGEGCQESFNIGLEEANAWWNKHTAGCGRCSGRKFERPIQPVGCKHFVGRSCIYEVSGYTPERCRYCLKVSKPCKEPYRPAKVSAETAKSNRFLISKKADNRYYKLADGNILDLETKTILFRDGLLQIMQ